MKRRENSGGGDQYVFDECAMTPSFPLPLSFFSFTITHLPDELIGIRDHIVPLSRCQFLGGGGTYPGNVLYVTRYRAPDEIHHGILVHARALRIVSLRVGLFAFFGISRVCGNNPIFLQSGIAHHRGYMGQYIAREGEG